MAYNIPYEVLERERLRVKELRANKKGGRLPNGAAQFVHDGITYTLSANKKARHGLEVKVATKEAAKESRRRGLRLGQSVKQTPEQRALYDQQFDDARMFSEATGQQYHVDHKNPVNKGGIANDPDNTQVVLGAINTAAGDATEGPLFEAKMANGLQNGQLLNRLRALNMDRAAMLEYIAQMQGAMPGELAAASRETTARQNKMSEIAQSNGGINGMPDFGISEALFGRSLVNDGRQDFAR